MIRSLPATDGSIRSLDMIEREGDLGAGIRNGMYLAVLYFWLPLGALVVLL